MRAAEMRNAPWGFDARMTSDGVEVIRSGQSWRIGIQPASLGRGECLRPLGSRTVASARADRPHRVEYRREDGALCEWYLNDERGLQQGFTLREAPIPGGEEPLVLVLDIEGAHSVRVSEDGRAAYLLAPGCLEVLSYAGLRAWDAAGSELRTRMEILDGERVAIHVSDQGATYPITIDPICTVQKANLVQAASLVSAGDFFGFSVDLDGNTAVIGAVGDDTIGVSAGAAYVLVYDGSAWVQQAKLTASDGATADLFGTDVAIDGETIVVTARLDDDLGDRSGSAYVFTRSGTVWTEQQKLLPNDGRPFAEFGKACAISGDSVIVGAYLDSSVDLDAGTAYVFLRSGTVWSQEQRLDASDANRDDTFGADVAIDADTAVVSAPLNDDAGNASGRVYVFTRAGTVWTESQWIDPAGLSANDQFGGSVSVHLDTLLAGAALDDERGSNAGAAYVFTRSGTVWSEQQKLVASDGVLQDQFGYSTDIEGDLILVGARFSNARALDSGAAYAFRYDGTAWDEGSLLVSASATNDDHFGGSVALSNGRMLAGAIEDDDLGTDSGAAFVFEIGNDVSFFCRAKTNSLGCLPFLVTSGNPSPTATEQFLIECHNMSDIEFGFFLYSTAGKAALDFHGGKLCIKTPFQRLLPPKAPKSLNPPPCAGVLRWNFNSRIQSGVDPELTTGQKVWAQWRQRDPLDPTGFGDALSNGVQFTICP
jgi:hypothetical protein